MKRAKNLLLGPQGSTLSSPASTREGAQVQSRTRAGDPEEEARVASAWAGAAVAGSFPGEGLRAAGPAPRLLQEQTGS